MPTAIQLLKVLSKPLVKNGPVVLTILGAIGVGGTAVLTSVGTKYAQDAINEEVKLAPDIPLPFKERARIAVPYFIPALIVGGMTIACIVGSHSVGMRRLADVSNAYLISRTAFQEYQDKVRNTYGKNKELAIRDEIAKDHLRAAPSNPGGLVIVGGDGVLFYDSLSKRIFRSNMETVRKAWNDFNLQLRRDVFLDANEWFSMIGLDQTDLGAGIGWDINRSPLELHFSTQMYEEREPCIVLEYVNRPINQW